jgi:hypothetical protein
MPSRRVLLAAGACAASLVAGVAIPLASRGPVEPPAATWRALGQQVEKVDAGVAEEVIEGPRVRPPPRPVTLAPELPAQPPALRAVVAVTPGAEEPRAEGPHADARADGPRADGLHADGLHADGRHAEDRRAAERHATAAQHMSGSGTSHAKGTDKHGARKGAGAPRDHNVAAAASRTAPGPREACGDRSFFGMAFCVNRQCESPRFMQHPYCVELRRQWQERRMRLDQARG